MRTLFLYVEGAVTHLHCDKSVFDLHLLGEKVGANRRLVLVGELLGHKLVHERRLSDTAGEHTHSSMNASMRHGYTTQVFVRQQLQRHRIPQYHRVHEERVDSDAGTSHAIYTHTQSLTLSLSLSHQDGYHPPISTHNPTFSL